MRSLRGGCAMTEQKKAPVTVGAVNQGKVTRESRSENAANVGLPEKLSMVRCRVTPRGRVISAGRAFR